MRVVVQRVNKASVSIKDQIVAKITNGLVILLGIEVNDAQQDCLWLARKIASLRIFSDEDGRMNDSILDVDGEVIVVSQFTLHAKIKKGNRPSYIQAAGKEQAVELYEKFKNDLSESISKEVFSGDFGADMQVSLVNNGPVTIIIDTKNKE